MPVLKEHGFPATVFVPTGAIGDCNRWDVDSPTAGLAIMSPEELREADANGLTVESHGHRHINLATATSVSAFDDLSRSVEILTDLIGRAPAFLAYPWGRVAPSVEDAAVQLRFRAAFTIGTRDRGQFARSGPRPGRRWAFAIPNQDLRLLAFTPVLGGSVNRSALLAA